MRTDEIFEKIQKNSREYKDQLAYLRADEMRSDLGKAEDISELYESYAQKHEELEQAYRKDLAARLERSQAAAFSYPSVSTDDGINTMIRRDAADRAGKASTADELLELLGTAKRADDSTLAVSVLRRAFDVHREDINPMDSVIGAALETDPRRAENFRVFQDIASEHNALEQLGISAITGAFGPERPPEAGGRPEQSDSGTARGVFGLEQQIDSISSQAESA